MQKKTFYLMGLLAILFLGSSIVLGGDSGVCLIPSANDHTIFSSPAEPLTAPSEDFTVPRNQVLLELFAATW